MVAGGLVVPHVLIRLDDALGLVQTLAVAPFRSDGVTRDGDSKRQPGGILGNRHKLRGLVEILSPLEPVELVRAGITERDNHNRRVAAEFGVALPMWTGKD